MRVTVLVIDHCAYFAQQFYLIGETSDYPKRYICVHTLTNETVTFNTWQLEILAVENGATQP